MRVSGKQECGFTHRVCHHDLVHHEYSGPTHQRRGGAQVLRPRPQSPPDDLSIVILADTVPCNHLLHPTSIQQGFQQTAVNNSEMPVLDTLRFCILTTIREMPVLDTLRFCIGNLSSVICAHRCEERATSCEDGDQHAHCGARDVEAIWQH